MGLFFHSEGVNGVWLIMQDMKLEPPEELIVKVCHNQAIMLPYCLDVR